MQQPKKPAVVFTGGGTGGHVFPGLAVASELLSRKDWDVVWLGAKGGMEESLVKPWNIRFIGVQAGKLRRYFSLHNIIDLFKIAVGFFQALRHLSRLKPLFLFSKGGFVSVPPVWAAKFLKIPVYSHESDQSPGLATRLNMTKSTKIFCAYEETKLLFPKNLQPRVFVTGNPVRKEIFQGNPQVVYDKWNLDSKKPLILVLGGSQGARQINQLMAEAGPKLSGKAVIIHQTGKEGSTLAKTQDYIPWDFFTTEMPHLLKAAKLIISRSGAGSLWEMAAVGVPGILIPLGAGSRGDQVLNAEIFEKAGGALVLKGEVKAEDLLTAVDKLLSDENLYRSMKSALETFGAAQASGKIVDHLLEGCDV